jgi:hypothetical protein
MVAFPGNAIRREEQDVRLRLTPEQRELKGLAKKLAAEAIILVVPEFDGRKIPGRVCRRD